MRLATIFRPMLIALLAAASVWLGISPALAASVDAGRYVRLDGPRLAGGEVVWVEYPDAGGYVVRGSPLAGGPTRVLWTSDTTERRVRASIAASSEQVLVQQFVDPIADRATIRIGADGDVARVGPACGDCQSELDVSANTAIFTGPPGGAMIRDFGPLMSEQTVDGARDLFQVAGRFAAWAGTEDLVVYDRVSRSEVYRIPDILPHDSAFSLDLQEDGKTAFYYPNRTAPRFDVGWASPAEPFVHRLPVPGAGYEVKIAGDIVAYLRGTSEVFSRREDLGSDINEVGMVTLDGRHRTLVRRVVSDGFDHFFDFDGERLAWQERTCDGVRVAFQDLAVLMARPRLKPPLRCPLRLRSRARVEGRVGHLLRLPLDCVGFSRGCFVRRAVVRTARRYRLGRRTIAKGTRVTGLAIGPRSAETARLRLTGPGRRLVRRNRPLRLRLTANIGDPSQGIIQRRSVSFSVR